MILLDVSESCSLECKYCYMKGVKNKVNEREFLGKLVDGEHYCFHGKEPLMNVGLVEKVVRRVKGRFSMQTNGVLLSGRIAEKIGELDIEIGVSLDGPAELNVLRCDEKTTKKIEENVRNFVKKTGKRVGIICVLTNENTPFIKTMLSWIDSWDCISSWRFNPVMFHNKLRAKDCELIDFYSALMEKKIAWSPFNDYFLPEERKSCSWKGCDFESSRIPTILPDGKVTSCLKGRPRYSWRPPTGNRVEFLSQLPKEMGGCKDCVVWEDCKGGCPHEARGFRRSEYCKVWEFIFTEARRTASANSNISSN